MIRVYYLETERIDNTDTVKGIEYIHDAILTQENSLWKLIQDTINGEHARLVAVCVSWRIAIAEEIAQYEAYLATIPPPPEHHSFTPVFQPPDLPGVAQRVDYIEAFLKALYP